MPEELEPHAETINSRKAIVKIRRNPLLHFLSMISLIVLRFNKFLIVRSTMSFQLEYDCITLKLELLNYSIFLVYWRGFKLISIKYFKQRDTQ